MITQSTVFNTNGTIFEVLEPRLLLDAAPDYLIIAGHAFFDGQGNVCAAIQQLADWKQMKGFQSQVADMLSVGSDSTDVANFIKGGSADPNDPVWEAPPKYVLLVGGDDGDNILEDGEVPAASSWCLTHWEDDHVTDNPYAELYAEDYSALDLAIGRIPLSTVDDVTIAINKILAYDRTPDVPGPEEVNWYANALVAATYLGRTEENNPTDVYETGGYFMETAHRVADFIGPSIPDYDFWDDEEEPPDVLNPCYHVGYNVYTALALDPWAEPNLELNADWIYHYNNGAGELDTNLYFPGRGPFPDPIPGVCGPTSPSGWLGEWTDRYAAGVNTVNAFNDGLGLVLYRDHGAVDGWTFGLNQSALFDTDALDGGVITNYTATPVVLSMGCLTGQFSNTYCFASELLRTQGAAVGVIAATDETQPGYTDCLTNGLFTGMSWAPDVAFDMNYIINYQDLFGNYCDFLQNFLHYTDYQAPERSMRPAEALVFADFYAKACGTCTPNDFQWFGDPEMMLRTEAPRPLVVTVSVPPGGGYGFQVMYEDGTTPIRFGRVCLSKTGESDYWAADTDSNGYVSFATGAVDVRGFCLVATGLNAVPFQAVFVPATGDPDTITLTRTDDEACFNMNNSQILYSHDLDEETLPFFVCGMAGNDTLTVDFSAGNPLPAAGLVYDGGAGELLQILGTTGNDAVTLASTEATVNGAAITYTSATDRALAVELGEEDDTITVNSGSFLFTNDVGPGSDELTVTLTLNNAAIVTFGASQHLAALNLADTSTATLSADGPAKTLVTGTLSIAGGATPTARLDITDNFLVVDYTGDSPVADVLNWIRFGFNEGEWNGNGICSSSSALTSGITAVGWGEQFDMITNLGPYGPGNPFGDYEPDDTAVLVRYTLTGDVNLDGIVDDLDMTFLSIFYDPSVPAGTYNWAQGDVWAYDGIVDDADITFGSINYGSSV